MTLTHNSPLTHGPCAEKCGTCRQGIRRLGEKEPFYCAKCGHAGCPPTWRQGTVPA